VSINLLFDQIQSLLQSEIPRSIIGIVGKPGAGKSTVVLEIEKRFDSSEVCVIPMDGYHLSNETLIELGRRDRKGAPDTFATQAFISLITKVKSDHKSEHRFPIFYREIEASKEDEGIVPIGVKVIVIEGNYLFSEEHNWNGVFPLLDYTWFIEIDNEVRMQRLIARHIKYGKTPGEAEDWSRGSDEANARFIELTAYRAAGIIKLT
jgi:pantothenate kinase